MVEWVEWKLRGLVYWLAFGIAPVFVVDLGVVFGGEVGHCGYVGRRVGV